MEKGSTAKAKDEKAESKDLRSNPPTKVKLPVPIKPSPPPVKDKPNKFVPKANGDVPPLSLKRPEESDSDQFDGVDVATEKLSHPTANRAKPPQRRPPSALVTVAPCGSDQTEPVVSPKNPRLPGLTKDAENLAPSPSKTEQQSKTSPPTRPSLPKALLEAKVAHDDKPSLDSLQAEVRELRMALELIQTRHQLDMQELKEELRDERNKRMALQEEVHSLRT